MIKKRQGENILCHRPIAVFQTRNLTHISCKWHSIHSILIFKSLRAIWFSFLYFFFFYKAMCVLMLCEGYFRHLFDEYDKPIGPKNLFEIFEFLSVGKFNDGKRSNLSRSCNWYFEFDSSRPTVLFGLNIWMLPIKSPRDSPFKALTTWRLPIGSKPNNQNSLGSVNIEITTQQPHIQQLRSLAESRRWIQDPLMRLRPRWSYSKFNHSHLAAHSFQTKIHLPQWI